VSFFLLLCGGFLLWGLLLWHLDRPHYPAWQVRNLYRGLNILLVFLLLLVGWKAAQYRMELRFQIHLCQ